MFEFLCYTGSIGIYTGFREIEKKGAMHFMSVISFVLGLLSVLSALIFGVTSSGWISVVLGVAGIIAASLAAKTKKDGFSTAGLVLSIIGLVLGALFFFACYMIIQKVSDTINSVGETFEGVGDIVDKIKGLLDFF